MTQIKEDANKKGNTIAVISILVILVGAIIGGIYIYNNGGLGKKGTLIDPFSFNEYLMEQPVTEVYFVDTPVPTEAVWDILSVEKNSSILGYREGTKVYITSGKSGVRIKANENCSNLFNGCASLTYVDLSNLDTSEVKYMAGMFNGCESLTAVDLSNLDTSNVTDMTGMFDHCEALEDVDVSGFNTSSVTNMNSMFYDCHALTSLDLSSFNTENVIEMISMFSGCNNLETITLGQRFHTEKVTDMSEMFQRCKSLTKVNIESKFSTKSSPNTSEMFDNCGLATSEQEKIIDPSEM